MAARCARGAALRTARIRRRRRRRGANANLQGVYDSGTCTPGCSGPAQVGDEEVLWDEEPRALQADIAYQLDRDRRDGSTQAERAPFLQRRLDGTSWRAAHGGRREHHSSSNPPDSTLRPRVRRRAPRRQGERDAAEAEHVDTPLRYRVPRRAPSTWMSATRCRRPAAQPGQQKPVSSGHLRRHGAGLQAPGYMVVYAEMIHFSVIIPVDGRPPLPDTVETWLGDSARRLGGRHAGRRDEEPVGSTPTWSAAPGWSTAMPTRGPTRSSNGSRAPAPRRSSTR